MNNYRQLNCKKKVGFPFKLSVSLQWSSHVCEQLTWVFTWYNRNPRTKLSSLFRCIYIGSLPKISFCHEASWMRPSAFPNCVYWYCFFWASIMSQDMRFDWGAAAWQTMSRSLTVPLELVPEWVWSWQIWLARFGRLGLATQGLAVRVSAVWLLWGLWLAWWQGISGIRGWRCLHCTSGGDGMRGWRWPAADLSPNCGRHMT